MHFRFRAAVWEHDGEAAWHFLTLPPDVADEIGDAAGPDRRGFGSVRVEVTIGATTWATSVFPDKRSGSFVLPLRKQVRSAEGIADGDRVDVILRVLGT